MRQEALGLNELGPVGAQIGVGKIVERVDRLLVIADRAEGLLGVRLRGGMADEV